MCQLSWSQIVINNWQLPPQTHTQMGVKFVCSCWLMVHACICTFPVVYISIYEACLRMCVHCRQFVHIHTLTYTHKRKKTKPISLFQTHQWSSWGSLVQSKTAIVRCRRGPVESWNLSRRLLTWRHKTSPRFFIFSFCFFNYVDPQFHFSCGGLSLLLVPVFSVYTLFIQLLRFSSFPSPCSSSSSSVFFCSLLFILKADCLWTWKLCSVLRCPASLIIKGWVWERGSPSALSPTRQANRRHRQIRIMRGTLAWTDWSDTHTGTWSHISLHARIYANTHQHSHSLSTVCLCVCLSVCVSVCSFICIFLFWHDYFKLRISLLLFF